MNNFEYKENNKQFLVSVGLQNADSIHELNKDYKQRYKDEVVVVKTITLSDKDFGQFINYLLDDYNFIKDNEKLYKVEIVDIDYARLDKVMLITSQGVDFGIIVDTQGYDYARYTAYYKKIKTPITLQELISNVQKWSIDKELHEADPIKQTVKLVEELGELASGLLKDKKEVIVDSLGDILVVLIILHQQLGYRLDETLAYAWNEIKDRKGKTIDGTFIKEEDL